MLWCDPGLAQLEKHQSHFCEPKMNSNDYQNIMAEHIWLHSDETHIIYQQDNAPIQGSKSTFEWFDQNAIVEMDWPDINPIENLWEIFARKAYAVGKNLNLLMS